MAGLRIGIAAIVQVSLVARRAPLPIAIEAGTIRAEVSRPANVLAAGEVRIPRDAAGGEEDLIVAIAGDGDVPAGPVKIT
jgi:hypothetical protein